MESFIVYSHVNKLNNITYIGITKREPKLRWANGFGYKNNPYFWRAIVKYGWDGFTHNILHTNLNKKEAITIEEELISHYKKLKLSYNISDGKDYLGKLRSKPIVAYTKGGEFIGKYPSIAEAARIFNLSETGIYYCIILYKGTKYISNYIFLYPEDSIEDRLNLIKNYKRRGHSPSLEARKRISEAMKHRVVSLETRRKMRENNLGKILTTPKKVIMLSLNGEQLKTFNSIKEASEYVGKPKLHSKISDCCNGKRNKTCGYKWKYVEQ